MSLAARTSALLHKCAAFRTGGIPARRILPVITTLLYVAPIWPLLTGVSVLISYWEFVATRYYASLSVLNGDMENAWVVQGIPMGLLQHAMGWLLWTFDPTDLGKIRQMEQFA